MNYRTLITTAFAGAALIAITANAEDQGAAIAAASQDGPSAVSVPVDNFVSASDKVQENLGKLGLSEGYDADKKSIIVVGSALLAAKNPAGDDSFMIKRSRKATEAYLNAKAEIIRAFSMNFSAADQIATAAEFGQSEAEIALAAKIDEVKEKLAAFAAKAGKPELADAAIDDKLVAALKGLTFDAPAPTPPQDGANDAPPQENPLAAERDALAAEVQSVVSEAKAIPKEPVNDSTSSVSLLAKMPLLGATVLTQAESWDKNEGIYEVAMAVLWSPKLQEEAKKLACGTPEPSEKKGKFTANEWIAQQDILAMVGPRRFTDSKGNSIVLGIAARDITGIPVVKIKPAKMLADTDAMKAVATSLMCDLEAFREAKSSLQEFADDSSKATESITDKIASKTDLQLSGVLRLASKEALHPLTGRKTYAVAYYLDPVLSKDAMDRIKQLYADAITVENATKYKRGQLAGAEAKYEEAKASTEKFEEGKAEAAADVAGRVRAEEVKAKVEGAQGSAQQQGAQKGGVVSGDKLDTVDLDF